MLNSAVIRVVGKHALLIGAIAAAATVTRDLIILAVDKEVIQ